MTEQRRKKFVLDRIARKVQRSFRGLLHSHGVKRKRSDAYWSQAGVQAELVIELDNMRLAFEHQCGYGDGSQESEENWIKRLLRWIWEHRAEIIAIARVLLMVVVFLSDDRDAYVSIHGPFVAEAATEFFDDPSD